MISWYSETLLPDLGGNENKNFRNYLFENDSYFEAKENKGFYRNYCVEISIHHIAVNAILQASHIFEFDKLDFQGGRKEMIDLNINFAETKGSEFDTPEKCT